MKAILQQALEEIKPSAKEEKETKERINTLIKKIQKSVSGKVILGGSGQKGTWLRNAHDADIFVQFPASYKNKDISSVLGKALRKFKAIRLHGSRDYFQIKEKKFTFEIIPIIKIKKAKDAENITDVSPLHSIWVRKHKKYADDIRLTKQFFKAAKVYGAESYINGFSGYICEVLSIYYKGFTNVVKAISKWKAQVIVDAENHFKGRKINFELNAAKRRGPLIIIDPVQESRNAAAAVSQDKFEQIIAYAKKFLKKPSIDFFHVKKIDTEHLKKKGELVVCKVKPLAGKKDVVGSKLLKCLEHIKKGLARHDFSLLFSDWEWDKEGRFYFVLKKEVLSENITIQGPPLKRAFFVKEFKKKHKKVKQDKKRIYAIEKRKYRKASLLISNIIKDTYIKERVKSIELQ